MPHQQYYDFIIAYRDKWFDFSTENMMMGLRPNPQNNRQHYGSTKRGVCTHQKEVQKARQVHAKSTIKKSTAVLENIWKPQLTSMFGIVAFVLSVPGLNAFVERIIMVSLIFCNK